MPQNNRLIYPRHAEFVPLAAPRSCFKTSLAAAEEALVFGRAPTSTAAP